MACAVEAIAAHSVFLIYLIRESVHIRAGRHCLVKSSVEHTHLWHVGHNLADSLDAHDVGWVVERSQVVAFLHLGDNLVGDEHARIEFLASVHHAVAYGVDFSEILDAAIFSACQIVEDDADSHIMVWHRRGDCHLFAVVFEFQERVGQTHFFHAALGEDVLRVVVEFNQLVFHR